MVCGRLKSGRSKKRPPQRHQRAVFHRCANKRRIKETVMTRKKILGSHVKRLMSGVADHGRQHLTEVETDLIQTGLLLEEAIEKLSFNFMAIHKAVEAEQATIAQLLAGGEVTEEQRTQLAALQGQVGGYVNAALTNLQFQDMTSQLLD